ncbi:MAG: GNAT family N-acetyltransferase, partial [Streptosporangiaceae bacterium]
SRLAADQAARRLCRRAGPEHAAVSAWLAGDLVAVAGYELDRNETDSAEIALAVADQMHHRGAGTLLLEHLASLARARGIRAFRADVLTQNHPMMRVFGDVGLEVHTETHAGVHELTLILEPGERYLDTVAERERVADVASLAQLLCPSSVVVVGAGRHLGSVGQAVLENLSTGGFSGALYAVNPHAGDRLLGVVCAASVADLPEAPELAVIAVPAHSVAGAARACGRRGVRALVVVTSGLQDRASRELREACHRYGMRLVGPNCLGIANPAAGLAATFAPHPWPRGTAGIAVQSGGVGITLLAQLSRLGIGVSSFVSMGDKYDVSANDLLQWWESDGITRLGLLHVESFGNPRKFARTARRVGRTMPLLTVLAGRSDDGRRAAASHTSASATPAVTQDALFAQAGIVVTHTLGDLVGAAALLGTQPAPTGPRVAIVTNAGGIGVLAADACSAVGLTLATLGERTREELARALPAMAAYGNPVDTTAVISPDLYNRCLDLVCADEGVDALLAVVCPTTVSVPSLARAGGTRGKPLAGVVLNQAESILIRDGVPCYPYPENAVRALGHAWSHSQWLSQPRGDVPAFDGISRESTKELIDAFLHDRPEGGWLSPAEAMALLGHYGVPVTDWCWAESAEAAARAHTALGSGRVVMKAEVHDVVHKTRAEAVQLDLYSPEVVREAYHWFDSRFGDRLRGVLIQRMEPAGVEVLCGIVQDPVFGPLVVFGLGGTATDVLDDRTARLTPLTDLDAQSMVGSLRTSALLLGERSDTDVAGIENILLRLGRLADDHPEIAEVDVNPVIVLSERVVVVDARVRISPKHSRWDPYLRKLR